MLAGHKEFVNRKLVWSSSTEAVQDLRIGSNDRQMREDVHVVGEGSRRSVSLTSRFDLTRPR